MECVSVNMVVTVVGILLTVIGTGAAIISIVYSFLRNFKEDINGKIGQLEGDLNRKIDHLDEDIRAIGIKLDADTKAHTYRTDQLYQMFTENSHNMAVRMEEFQKMFYELLKAQTPKTNP